MYSPVDGGRSGWLLFYYTAFKTLNYARKLRNPGLVNADRAHRAPPRQTGRRGAGRPPSQVQLKEPLASHAHTHACTQIKSTLAKRDLLRKQELATQITPDKWIKYNDLPVIKILMSIKSNCFLNLSIHPIQI